MSDPLEKARLEILAAIGLRALREMQGQPERIQDLFNSLMPLFRDRYPHHKLLSHMCREASAPLDVTPGKVAIVERTEGWFAATLADGRVIERDDLLQLADELKHLGYKAEEVREFSNDGEPERWLSDDQKIVLMAAMNSKEDWGTTSL